MASFWTRMKAGIYAFREAYLNAGVEPGQDTDWSDASARSLRYALYWSYFENTAYRDVHRWTQSMRSTYGLYTHTRSIYSPAMRLAEFWVSHLLGGPLDPKAGELRTGTTGSAIPIVLGESVKVKQGKALRGAIAQLWRDSNWQVGKDIYTRYGSVMGDVGLKIVDDPLRSKVYLQVVHPGSIADVTLDPFGHVKAYTIEETRRDPRSGNPKQTVTYRETATRDGDSVVYQTTLNGQPYAWNGVAAEWAEPYGFIPLVITQHLNVGLSWGWSELHAGLPKIRELDDIASKLDDQIRKTVDAPWLFAGVKKPESTPTVSRTGASGETLPSTTNRETGREEIPILYASDSQAKAQALIAPLDIPAVIQQVHGILKDLERDYPELALDVIATAGADTSGRALRIAREPVENKVLSRRSSYDSAMVRAQQMAIAIAGFRGYDGYAGFDLDSYASGALDHSVAPRPVFAVDPMDQLAREEQFWTVATLATQHLPIELYLEDAGWDEEKIARVSAEKQKKQAEAAKIAAQQQQTQPGQQPGDGTAQQTSETEQQ